MYPEEPKKNTLHDAAQSFFVDRAKHADESASVLRRIGEMVMERLAINADSIFLSIGLPKESQKADLVQFSAFTAKKAHRSDRRIWEAIIQIELSPPFGKMVLWEVIGVGFELGKARLYMDGNGVGPEFRSDDPVDTREAVRMFVGELERHWIDVIQSNATFNKDRREITGFRVE